MILKILKRDPKLDDWTEIGKMIEEGYTTRIDRPVGLNWTVEWKPSSNKK